MYSLKVKDLSLQAAKKIRLNNVSFAIPSGKKVALVGLNGAGKSSLIKLLVGELKPNQGSITYPSHPLSEDLKQAKNLKRDILYPTDLKFKDHLGYQAANMQSIAGLSALEYLKLCCQFKKLLSTHNSEKKIQKVSDDWNLGSILQTSMTQLSQGNMQKLMIASAFLGKPKIIMLDEPTQALDPIEQERFKTNLTTLKNYELCLFSSHHISEAVSTADIVVMLHHGRLVALLNLNMIDEFWAVTQLTLEEVSKHFSEELVSIEFSNKKNLIKVKGLSNDGWLAFINKLSLEDSELVDLGEASKALMPLFSLLANENL